MHKASKIWNIPPQRDPDKAVIGIVESALGGWSGERPIIPLLQCSIIPFTIFCLLFGIRAVAQRAPEYTIPQERPTVPYGGAQYYVYLGADRELQINAQVWGCVQKPGVYSIPKTTDLVGFLAFAGGPSRTANTKKIRIVRSNPKPEVIIVNLNKHFCSPKPELLPLIKPGDTVIVPEQTYYKFMPVLAQCVGVISQVALIWHIWYVISGK